MYVRWRYGGGIVISACLLVSGSRRSAAFSAVYGRCKRSALSAGRDWEQVVPLDCKEEDVCLVPPGDEEIVAAQKAMFAETALFDRGLQLFPVASTTLAFVSYESVAKWARMSIDFFGKRQSWTSVDGNVYEIAILAPTINGVVMPSVSIALGTLAAATVSSLRLRQLDVRERLNRELGEIELLRTTIAALDDNDFAPSDDKITAYATLLLRDYVSRVAFECRPNAAVGRVCDTELNALYRLFLDIKDEERRSNPASASALTLVNSLVALRAGRLTLLASSYPPTQFFVLAFGSLSIVVAFLLESDQEVLRFLDAIQLRLLFSILVGVFSGLAAVVIDLADITRGTFRITTVAAQLFALRDLLTYDLCCLDGSDLPPRWPHDTSFAIKKPALRQPSAYVQPPLEPTLLRNNVTAPPGLALRGSFGVRNDKNADAF